jgi:hypothetical protein
MENFKLRGLYYKYKSLKGDEDLDRFNQIIRDCRIYGSTFTEMNDPMEGCFHTYLQNNRVESLKNEKQQVRICCLADRGNNGLMWSHYADSNNGYCLEVAVDEKKIRKDKLGWKKHKVKYTTKVNDLKATTTPEELLEYKGKYWRYEKETRYMKRSCVADSLPVRITRIFLGCRMKPEMQNKVINILKECGFTLSDSVYMMKPEDLDYGFNI